MRAIVNYPIRVFALLALLQYGCGGEPSGTTTDAGADSGQPSVDTCVAPMGSGAETADCNGLFVQPPADNLLGGACNPEADACIESTSCLAAAGEDSGLCVIGCSAGEEFISKSGCPGGTRCVDLALTGGLCLPSCETHDDCASGVCILTEGFCWVPGGGVSADHDGGVLPGNLPLGNVSVGNLGTVGNFTTVGNLATGNLVFGGGVSTGNVIVTGGIAPGNIAITGNLVIAGGISTGGIAPGNLVIGNLVISGGISTGGVAPGNLVIGGIGTGNLVISGGISTGGVAPGNLVIGGIGTGNLVISGGISTGGVAPGNLVIGGISTGGISPGGIAPGNLVVTGGIGTGGISPGNLVIGGIVLPGNIIPGGFNP